ncbi:MAG: hypothetical protein OQJ89_08985, partial [Kangiellaceae bacterium]|nr:hypothetical protein [Kangiellaceae bacterium]
TFTRMPPSSMVGKYVVTVIPRPNDKANKYSCKQKTINFLHNTAESRKQFTFNCQLSRSSNPRVANNQRANSTGKECHNVKIQKQEGNRQSVISKACKQKDGSWKIEHYRY